MNSNNDLISGISKLAAESSKGKVDKQLVFDMLESVCNKFTPTDPAVLASCLKDWGIRNGTSSSAVYIPPEKAMRGLLALSSKNKSITADQSLDLIQAADLMLGKPKGFAHDMQKVFNVNPALKRDKIEAKLATTPESNALKAAFAKAISR